MSRPMETEEAIEILQEEHDWCQEPQYVISALETAIASLQESEWRERGCYLCSDTPLCGTCRRMLNFHEDNSTKKCYARTMDRTCKAYSPMAACPNCGRLLIKSGEVENE